MKKATLTLETLACPTCMQKIEGAIKQLPGIDKESVRVRFNASKADALFDPTLVSLHEIVNAVTNIGYDVLSSKES